MRFSDPLQELRHILERDLELADQLIARYDDYVWTILGCKDAFEATREKLAQALSNIEEVDQIHGVTQSLCEPPWDDLPDDE